MSNTVGDQPIALVRKALGEKTNGSWRIVVRVLGLFAMLTCSTPIVVVAQQSTVGVVGLKYYLVRWDSKPHLPRTIDNLPEHHTLFAITAGLELADMFLNREDCVAKLQDVEIVPMDSVGLVCARVEIFFAADPVIIGFDEHGNFLFDGGWHRFNGCLYAALFTYFSYEIIPSTVLKEATERQNDGLWCSN
jgi:hypothetical protein